MGQVYSPPSVCVICDNYTRDMGQFYSPPSVLVICDYYIREMGQLYSPQCSWHICSFSDSFSVYWLFNVNWWAVLYIYTCTLKKLI